MGLEIKIIKKMKNDINPKLYLFGCIFYQNQYIITFGGFHTDDIYIYKINNNKWIKYKSSRHLPKNMLNPSCALIDGNIHIIYEKTFYTIKVQELLKFPKKEVTNIQVTC